MSEADKPSRIERIWKLKFTERDRVWPYVRLLWWLLFIGFLTALLLRIAGCGKPEPAGEAMNWEHRWKDDDFWDGEVNPGQPFDPGELIELPGDSSGRQVVSNALNLYMEESADLRVAARELIAAYPQAILGVMSYAEPYKRLTIRIEESERNSIKARLKQERPEVRFIFDESILESAQTIRDPGFSDEEKAWPYRFMGAWELWDFSEGSPDVTIAIIDDMFEPEHPELDSKFVDGWNTFEHNSRVQLIPSLASEHGTHVAGSAAGAKDNGVGVSGTAPGCSLMLLQASNNHGFFATSSLVDAIFYAANHGATVINMSIGPADPNDIASRPIREQERIANTTGVEEAAMWDELYALLDEQGVVVVQAAGNEDRTTHLSPMKRSFRTIVVGAISPDGQRADFNPGERHAKSNFGEYVTVWAPGTQIYSSVPGGEAFLQGTSMASPLVAGVVGILKSELPDASVEDIINILQTHGVPMSKRETRSDHAGYSVCMRCLAEVIQTMS